MAKRKKPKISAALEMRFEARVKDLIRQYSEHRDKATELIKDSHGWLVASEGGIDENRIFRVWLLQKLALLQLAVEDLDARQRSG